MSRFQTGSCTGAREKDLVVAALLAGGAGHVRDGAPGVNDERELLWRRPDVQPRRVVPESTGQQAPASRRQIQHSVPRIGGAKTSIKKIRLYRPVGEEIIVEAHAGVGAGAAAEPTPQRGGEPAGVAVGAREREHQRRPRRGPIGGSGGRGGGDRGGQEEDCDKGLERAEPKAAAARHGAASSRKEWEGRCVCVRGEVVAPRGKRPLPWPRPATCLRRMAGQFRNFVEPSCPMGRKCPSSSGLKTKADMWEPFFRAHKSVAQFTAG
jgi:hypothetical protein